MNYEEKPIKIHYQGEDFWFLQENNGGGPVAPLHHCDSEGNLNPLMMFSTPTYAHVSKDRVMRRYGQELCNIDELLGNK